MPIAENLAAVRDRIARAAEVAKRDPGSVKLVAVSKKQPASAIEAAYAAGQRDFGENYAQELDAKAAALSHLDGLSFHMIGHVQTNKAKIVTARAQWIHSVDSTTLARELGKRVAAGSPPSPEPMRVLVEVNLSGEATKSGVSETRLDDVIAAVRAEPGLELVGLMTMPPPGDLGMAERLFRRLTELGASAGTRELSMGMSDDLEAAIGAGSTIVRVGSAIFGAR
jgi:pyridoxal phosphate enzyme (YggS family)